MDPLHQFKKGVTTLVILDALEHGPRYAYGLRQQASKRTRGAFQFSEGALYPLLHSLQRKRWVNATRRHVAGRDRRYYTITPAGRHALTQLRRDWQLLTRALHQLTARPRRA
ncbi:MAG: PadR family transcriptional regulator [Verrucomicrobiia bacterium]|jgi:DNA-binding PadR family transcriptional regulator